MAFMSSVISALKRGLGKTREVVSVGLRSLLLGRGLDEALISEVEARLIQSDVGVKTTKRLIDGVRAAYRAGTMKRGDEVLEYLKRELKAMWPVEDRSLRLAPPNADGTKATTVILVAGINGAGKTTSVAKLAHWLREQGKSVLLAACDTYRAGAVRQLEIWSERLGVEVIKGQQGGDPAAVAFDACEAARARGADVLLVDTAGRLHTQDPLMRQLTKIRDVVSRRIPGAPHEVLLVLDATTGQNAVRQAEEFKGAIGVTGVFMAKLDGTARGGSVIAIREATGIPVKFVGLGETPADVQPFDPESFIEAMFALD
ncbi:MAG TPA: signal recognition particle-docking protein FtsY [Phycisphaerales bacterium]|nr:signal recognition particle-docking protein FtsY [Phycisphaerales bacterium]